ncbi:MAG: hypothetical protein DMG78_21605 [Acidobacteria bacterium]|nr:MAG: hypothetical protein DMG78_21605 [Acidobacteriota bacterium]
MEDLLWQGLFWQGPFVGTAASAVRWAQSSSICRSAQETGAFHSRTIETKIAAEKSANTRRRWTIR